MKDILTWIWMNKEKILMHAAQQPDGALNGPICYSLSYKVSGESL